MAEGLSPPPSLPPGWRKVWHEESNKHYYADLVGKTSQWEAPEPYLHRDWIRCVDSEGLAQWQSKELGIVFAEFDPTCERYVDDGRIYWSIHDGKIRFYEPEGTTAKPSELEAGVFLVDSLPVCAETVSSLLAEAEVAVDMEGMDLCRSGVVCLVQVATPKGSIYLFDIATLGQEAFEQGRLRELLQSEYVVKVIFDGRGDNDALFHRHRALMRPAYDLQILHALRHSSHADRFVKGLETCMDDSGVVPPGERSRLQQLKEDGKRLFAPDHGGSPSIWMERPLHPMLIKYAAVDVRYLLQIKRTWGTAKMDEKVKAVTAARINSAIRDPRPPTGPLMAIRDFSLGPAPAFLGKPAVDPRRCFHCGQMGHVARSCNWYAPMYYGYGGSGGGIIGSQSDGVDAHEAQWYALGEEGFAEADRDSDSDEVGDD